MHPNLNDLLPDDIFDEAAYHLVNFLMTLATELDAYYYTKMRRHWDNAECADHCAPSVIAPEPDFSNGENPF